MAYSTNLLPRASAYYTFDRAAMSGTDLVLEAGGSAEVQITSQMLPKMTATMLVVAHTSNFSSNYTNDGPQITISVITTSGKRIECLVPISQTESGVFNVEIELPEEEFYLFTYRLYSPVAVTFYNWELCSLEASDFTTIINGVEQEIPKLLYDYNTYAYAVAQKETTVGLISAFLHQPTDLQGHFTISFFATERCNVHVRVKDNGITELFSPQVYTVEKGYASVSIPHAYLKKLATAHAFSVTIQCSNGQLSIPVRGVLYTIDGGYLATRLLDAGIDVQDISIRQLSTDNAPSEIHAVGFEGNRILLKSRVYSQLQRADWTAIHDFGEGIDAAVEFNGSWTLRHGASKFTIDTEQQPYVFIVDTDKNLKVYYGAGYSESQQLDINVDMVSACRGYNSMFNASDDQGLIVAYLKEGNVYYRQYLYENSEYKWQGYIALYEGGDASFVSIHRLPDYRVGICVTHSTGTKWFITDRTYVSQGFKPEIVSTRTEGLSLTTVRSLDIADIDYSTASINNFEDTNIYHNNFIMTFPTRLIILLGRTVDHFKRAITVTIDNKVVPNAVDRVTVNNNIVTVILKEAVKGGKTVKLDYNFFFLAGIMPNNCYVATTQTYTWSLPLPTIRVSYKEKVSVGIKGTLNAIVTGPTVRDMPQNVPEIVPIVMDPRLDCTIGIIRHPALTGSYERVDVSVKGSVDIEISQVGTSPV